MNKGYKLFGGFIGVLLLAGISAKANKTVGKMTDDFAVGGVVEVDGFAARSYLWFEECEEVAGGGLVGHGLSVALSGVDILFMVSAPESEDRLDKHLAFVDAAAASGVRHIVYLSFMNAAPDATFTLARTHFHTEERIKASGMTYTFLRDNFYADFFVALPDEEGRILGPAGDGRVGVVAREDAGRVAAGILTDPARYENQTLDVTGPEALTLDEIAAILTRVQGRPVTYVRETIEEAYESRKKWPAAQWQYDSWVSTYTSIARGEMDVVSTTVCDVTGRDPLTFEEVARAALVSGR